MRIRFLLIVLLAAFCCGIARPVNAQEVRAQRTGTGTAGAIPYASTGFARLASPPLSKHARSREINAVGRSGRSVNAAPPSWHLPVAGAALGAAGGVIYIAARNKGETIAPPAGVLLPIPIGALLGYIAGVAVDEGLYGGSDR